MLQVFHKQDTYIIGVDEVGRGPLFGRVYAAAVILPHFGFKHELMKDSKKFTSSKKIKEIADYIKENCIAYSIMYQDEKNIDKHNILNATYNAMHMAIKEIMNNLNAVNAMNAANNKYLIIVDGNNFKPLTYYDSETETMKEVDTICVVNGDNTYSAIAAASILAKVERDNYIQELCLEYPKLNEYYGISKNKGYGTKQHMEAIKQYGITQWHRKTFGLCKSADLIDIGN
jgi:ribonuclease HII